MHKSRLPSTLPFQVQQLTKDIPLILESLRYSMDVEVQGDKVRRRNEWNKWLLSTGVVNSDSGSHLSSSAPENVLAMRMEIMLMQVKVTQKWQLESRFKVHIPQYNGHYENKKYWFLAQNESGALHDFG
ncbi:hypothetical protein C2S53_001753 [Perilla frutescens var. hirtella]|uniref:Uncharacterized protein n=1 Tax=Perilla frutescens var. hirtella TaxID=608512 RepID=A0AAD4PAV7_PERFH|nr:hypothetical protein C2S53_001753 [Perilla frutescens var. hirtella]